MRLFRVHAEMLHVDFRLRPGEPRLALKSTRVVVLVRELKRLFMRARDGGGERNMRSLIRFQSHALAKTEDGIKHRADGVRERAVFHHGDGWRWIMAASQKSPAVR